MSNIIMIMVILVVIMLLAQYCYTMEKYDSKKRKAAFATIRNDPKVINYLSFIQTQPIWRLSSISALITGLIFYIFYKALKNSNSSASDGGILTVIVMFLTFLSLNKTIGFYQFHYVCPNACTDRYDDTDKCSQYSYLSCDTPQAPL